MGESTVGGSEGINIYIHADIHATYFHPSRNNEIYFATDGGIFMSPDLGANFEGRNGGYQTSQFYANFSASKSDSKFAIGGMQDNGTAIYDGQDGWIKVIEVMACLLLLIPATKILFTGPTNTLV
ncbi:MAG: hypothetical protein IPP42_15365 [Saprospiraceae bacterium]|nr:hypothetical protein [Saprospiraceae bacterium]